MRRIIIASILLLFLAFPATAQRSVVTEWYIEDFQAEFVINDDSSIMVTERITADCGDLPGKHGIYRILPKYANTPEGKIKYPIKLLSITDANGDPHKYSVEEGLGTLTWKIGDADIEVRGENYYEIRYLIKNAIRQQDGFDEFYWNLSGNFWDMEIDNFKARVIFPEGIGRDNTEISIYSGASGEKGSALSGYEWVEKNSLAVYSDDIFKRGDGITLSASFPQGVIEPYTPSFFDNFSPDYFFYLLPLLVLVICFCLWKKYGDDPNFKMSIVPEYEIPVGLGPIEAQMLLKEGHSDNQATTATIIKLAVDGFLTIKKNKAKLLSFIDDLEFTKVATADASKLSGSAEAVYEALFAGRESVASGELKKDFRQALPTIEKAGKEVLFAGGYMEKAGFRVKLVLGIFSSVFLAVGFFMISETMSVALPIALMISGAIAIIFAAFMTKKTEAGALVAEKIKGFKLYVKTAEKHRAEFYEKENIFEKVLPYAIAFGLTKIWVKKIREIYGEEYFAAYHPLWYAGFSAGSFSVDSFTSSLNSLSMSISASVSSSSGHGGGGFSGGGGGGGGGGGW